MKGAVRYRIKVVESIVGALRTVNLVLTPAQMNGKPPVGLKTAPYKSPGRLGYCTPTSSATPTAAATPNGR